MRVGGWRRKASALLVLAMLGGLSWFTMAAGKPRELVLLLLCGFALRVLLTREGSRYDRGVGDVGEGE